MPSCPKCLSQIGLIDKRLKYKLQSASLYLQIVVQTVKHDHLNPSALLQELATPFCLPHADNITREET